MFQFTHIDGYHKALKSGTTTCEAAVNHYLECIQANQHLNAFTEVYESEALVTARALDNRRNNEEKTGRLHGVVIAIKDVICYKGHKVTAASGILKDFTSLYTATALQYLIDEEAIIIGSCNCDEFAMGSSNESSVYGPVKNALDESRVPGGSSGGSAVAVQAGMCMYSLGSDTGGSVRQPADFCGIIGFKPSYGSISRYGLVAYASSFDQIGIFGKHLNDVRLLWEIMSLPDDKDSTMNHLPPKQTPSSPAKKKLAIFAEALNHPGLDEEIKISLENFIEKLRAAGHTITEIPFRLFDYIVPSYYVLTTAEASSNLSRYDGIRFGKAEEEKEDLALFYSKNRSAGFGTEVKRRIMLGCFVLSTGYYDAYFAKAQQIRQLIVSQMAEILHEYDGVILPVSPATAFKFGEKSDPVSAYLADIYTVLANLAGLPAIALPMFSHSNNMPYGVQVMSKRGDEVTLLETSEVLLAVSAG
ncbi:MAG: Asp-tRNA(Asn)/Glu-tRNA(Gln) amidotransferase subunit GatA [Ferruginibacter sp.]